MEIVSRRMPPLNQLNEDLCSLIFFFQQNAQVLNVLELFSGKVLIQCMHGIE